MGLCPRPYRLFGLTQKVSKKVKTYNRFERKPADLKCRATQTFSPQGHPTQKGCLQGPSHNFFPCFLVKTIVGRFDLRQRLLLSLQSA